MNIDVHLGGERSTPLTFFHAAICSSLQRPESSGVMRPSGATAVASIMVRPGPRVKIPPTAGACG